MSNESSATESNGIAPAAPKVSALAKLLKDCEGKKVNESDRKKITNDFTKAMGERAKLQAALDAFDAKSDETAVNMVRCYGAKSITLGGVRYVPTSRGERVYYKKMSDTPDTIVLD